MKALLTIGIEGVPFVTRRLEVIDKVPEAVEQVIKSWQKAQAEAKTQIMHEHLPILQIEFVPDNFNIMIDADGIGEIHEAIKRVIRKMEKDALVSPEDLAMIKEQLHELEATTMNDDPTG